MKAASVLAVVAITCLSGCATTSPELERGVELYRSGDYRAAWQSWNACALQGEPRCMALIGAGFEEGRFPAADPRRQAVHWYTLSARHGFGWARNKLAMMGEPVPPPDLAPAPAYIDPRAAETLGEGLGQAIRRR
jgi:TPR repeat protein